VAVKCVEFEIPPCGDIPRTIEVSNGDQTQELVVDRFLTKYLRVSKLVNAINKKGKKVSFSTPEPCLIKLARYLEINENLLKTSHIYVTQKKFNFL
jgi:hypothetical protein